MKKLAIIAGVVVVGFGSQAIAESYYIPSYLEKGLVSICKSAAKDKVMRMSNTIDEFRLKEKTVALNVVCNGQDIITFAESYGAKKTTAKLSNSLGTVKVTDIAAVREYKYDVNFEF